MSLLGSIGSTLSGAVKGFVKSGFNPVGAVKGALTGLAKGTTSAPPKSAAGGSPILAALPGSNAFSASGLVRTAVVPAVKAVGSAVVRNAPTIGAVAAVGGLVYDMAGNVIGRQRKRRRMNPMNARAARRAIRRIKGARKMLQQIERQLPKQRTTARRAASSRSSETFIRQG
jgi:hypothetical protein